MDKDLAIKVGVRFPTFPALVVGPVHRAIVAICGNELWKVFSLQLDAKQFAVLFIATRASIL